MEQIDKSNPKYLDVVLDNNERDYEINASKLDKGESVVCPYDSDMSVTSVDEEGSVTIIKKSYRKSIFYR